MRKEILHHNRPSDSQSEQDNSTNNLAWNTFHINSPNATNATCTALGSWHIHYLIKQPQVLKQSDASKLSWFVPIMCRSFINNTSAHKVFSVKVWIWKDIRNISSNTNIIHQKNSFKSLYVYSENKNQTKV